MQFAILWYQMIGFRSILLPNPAHILCAFHCHVFTHILNDCSIIYFFLST